MGDKRPSWATLYFRDGKQAIYQSTGFCDTYISTDKTWLQYFRKYLVKGPQPWGEQPATPYLVTRFLLGIYEDR